MIASLSHGDYPEECYKVLFCQFIKMKPLKTLEVACCLPPTPVRLPLASSPPPLFGELASRGEKDFEVTCCLPPMRLPLPSSLFLESL